MKRELFNLADEEFMTLLIRTHEGFIRENIPYMYVGGVANQAHISHLLCKTHKGTLYDIVRSGKIRVQDYLRSTDDVDIVTHFEEAKEGDSRKEIEVRKEIFSILDYIVGEGIHISPSEQHFINIRLQRKAHVRPVFELGINDVINPDKTVSFNIYRKAEDLKNGVLKEFENSFYDLFLDNAIQIGIPYFDNKTIYLNVKNREHLLATKIARGRPKDLGDALSLVKHYQKAGEDITYSIIEEILCRKNKQGNYTSEELCRRYEAFRKLEQTIRI